SFSGCLCPLAPKCPPFPYTTLFGSLTDAVKTGQHRRRLWIARPVAGSARHAFELLEFRDRPVGQGKYVRVAGFHGVQGESRDTQDRKSTRLNSSHVEISYAVFCLKK